MLATATPALPRPSHVQAPHAVPFSLTSEELPSAPELDPGKVRPQLRMDKADTGPISGSLNLTRSSQCGLEAHGWLASQLVSKSTNGHRCKPG